MDTDKTLSDAANKLASMTDEQTALISTQLSLLIGSALAVHGVRKIAKRFGVSLTRREAYGLLVSVGWILEFVVPGRVVRMRTAVKASMAASAKRDSKPALKVDSDALDLVRKLLKDFK